MRNGLEQSQLYSEELGIDLARGTDAVYFCGFLASLLFGARILETAAKKTFQAFMRHGLTTPAKTVAAGWDFLVYPVMREGGYVRYDGRKSTQVLHRAGDHEHLLARASSLFGQSRSRSAAAREEAGETPVRNLARYRRKGLAFAREEAGIIRRRRESALK
jgi:hypothetical protein